MSNSATDDDFSPVRLCVRTREIERDGGRECVLGSQKIGSPEMEVPVGVGSGKGACREEVGMEREERECCH